MKINLSIIRYLFADKILLIKSIIVILLASSIIGGYLYVKSIRSELEIATNRANRYENNMNQYQSLLSKSKNDNRVLELSIDDLKYANDSLLHKIDLFVKSKNKNKPANPGNSAAGINTSINIIDSIMVPVECRVDTIINPNAETKIGVKLDSGLLKISTQINNTEILYVHSQREYVNKYKSKWHRFWKFDWKKRDVNRYDIENSNDIIKIKDIRVINITEK